jgi:hypothetical protein
VSKGDLTIVAAGGITFQVRPGEDFIDLELPKEAQSAWKKYWFYTLEKSSAGEMPMAQYSPEPRVPR